MAMILSCILPAYKEPYLNKTIDSILENSGLPDDQIEVIAVLDGADPVEPVRQDDRVKIVRLGKNQGMRESINAGVRVSRGEYLARFDAHQIVGERFGLILTSQTEDNWIVCCKRYFLDPIKWGIMDIPPVLYEKLVIQKTENGEKFSGQPWRSRDIEREAYQIDETMAMQGSFWLMKRSWWDKVIGELQVEGYGPLIQDSHEMQFKTWKAGGKLVLNKNTWHGHKHREFPRTHNNGTKETPAHCEDGFAYAIKTWKDYYLNEIVPKWGI